MGQNCTAPRIHLPPFAVTHRKGPLRGVLRRYVHDKRVHWLIRWREVLWECEHDHGKSLRAATNCATTAYLLACEWVAPTLDEQAEN